VSFHSLVHQNFAVRSAKLKQAPCKWFTYKISYPFIHTALYTPHFRTVSPLLSPLIVYQAVWRAAVLVICTASCTTGFTLRTGGSKFRFAL
jgi:hypothetical protein